jgi:putative ABC transport system ATP-binding protein
MNQIAALALDPMAPVTLPLLRARSLTRRFGTGTRGFSLHLIRLQVAAGQCVAVIGPSGCGKSTMLGLLSLALRPSAMGPDAALIIDGVDAVDLWRRERGDELTDLRATRLGFVPQTAALLSFLTLRANIELPQTISDRIDTRYTDQIAGWLDIADILHRKPAQVSVGQRQRAAIARALAHRPKIILADEPTASVHPSQADEILQQLSTLAKLTGAALVLATHDVARAEAAGYPIAKCIPDADGTSTVFDWDR